MKLSKSKCIDCGEPTSRGSKRCRGCYHKQRKKQDKYCKDCGKLLTGHDNPERCGSCARQAKNLSKETRQKMRDNHMGMTGKHVSKKNKLLIGIRAKGNKYSYKHGLTFAISKEFLKQENYICGCCGFQEFPEDVLTGKCLKLYAHHILEREKAPNKINDFSNLFCLCSSCHKLYHQKYMGNINKKSLFKFLINFGGE